MNEEKENRQIIIFWWNFGKKTLDFKGTYKDYLIKRNIKVRNIKHPFSKTKGFRFIIPLSSSIIKIDTFEPDYIRNLDKAIRHFLTELGDRCLFTNGYNQEFKINWI